MSDLSYYLAQIIDGVAYGSVYGLFALSIVMIYRANKLFNLAQTEMATLCCVIMILLMKKLPFAAAFAITLAIAFVIGALLHLGVMRVVTERRNVLLSNVSVITIGFFTVFNSISAVLLGDEAHPMPAPMGLESFDFHGVGISRHSVLILLVTGFLSGSIFLFFKFTKMGLIFEAIAENIEAAKLRAIPASNVLAFAWGITTMVAALGGILLAPILFVTPSMLLGIYAYSLIAVVIGGLESPLGALVGGIIVGVVENLASNNQYIGSELKFVAVMAVLIIILLVRPRGLWGRAEGRRV